MCISSQLDEDHLTNVIRAVRVSARKLSEWNGFSPYPGDEAVLLVSY
jgi:hypothetical protein